MAASIRPLALIAVGPFASFVESVVRILSSLRIVPVAVPTTIFAPAGFDRVSPSVSFDSQVVSPFTLTVMVPET